MAQGVTSSNPYFDAFRKHNNISSLDRDIAAELIKAIHIHEGGDVTIDFNFAFSLPGNVTSGILTGLAILVTAQTNRP